MYRKLDKTGMSLLESLGESGYVPHSPVEIIRTWVDDKNDTYSGVYEAVHHDESRTFVKSSLHLRHHPFTFADEETAVKHLNVYRRLSEKKEKLYDDHSFFALKKNERGYGIVACMPALLAFWGMNRKVGYQDGERIDSKLRAFFKRWPERHFSGDITSIDLNYGLAEDGEFYYFDLHLFKSIPSPLVDHPRVMGEATSA